MLNKDKNLVYWEEIEEPKIETRKRKIIKKIFGYISIFSGFIEASIIISISIKIKETSEYWIIPLVIGGFYMFKCIQKHWKVRKSKMILMYEEMNKRAIGHEGAQGAGKTSLMFYVASIMNAPIFTSAPARINGQMTYKLTEEIINMDAKIPLYSMVILDEITLYYDNELSKQLNHEKTEGLEMQMQLIRHAYDGQMLTASVDMNRLAKRVEEKHGMFRRLMGQRSVNNSIIIDRILKIISKIFKLDLKLGYRVWTYQTFENINHKGYIFDLSRQEQDTKNTHFANLNEVWAYNSSINFEYDDRYFKNLYLKLPKAELKQWQSLTFNYEELKDTGFSSVTTFFKRKYEKALNKYKQMKEGNNNGIGC